MSEKNTVELGKYLRQGRKQSDQIQTLVAKANVHNAKTSVPADLEMLSRTIRKTVGFDLMNEEVRSALKQCFTSDTLKETLNTVSSKPIARVETVRLFPSLANIPQTNLRITSITDLKDENDNDRGRDKSTAAPPQGAKSRKKSEFIRFPPVASTF